MMIFSILFLRRRDSYGEFISMVVFIYDLISAIQSQKFPFLKRPFSLDNLKKKYGEHLGEYKNLDFSKWVAEISVFGHR